MFQTAFETNPRLSPIQKEGLRHVQRPQWADVDLDWKNRPGVPMMHDPRPMPNTRYPPERQPGIPAVPKHGRPNKPFPPVFGTSTPLHGLSGIVRKAAYRFPDHKPAHWLLAILGDRVDSWTYHLKKYAPVLLPVAALGLFGRRIYRAAS